MSEFSRVLVTGGAGFIGSLLLGSLRGWRAPMIFSIFFVLLSVFAFRTVTTSDKDDAWRSIQRAEDAVSSAFEAVSDAENAGADVSGLVVELNRAVSLFSEARILFRNGDFDGAVRLVGLSVEIVEGVDRWELDGGVIRSVKYEGVKNEASRLKARLCRIVNFSLRFL